MGPWQRKNLEYRNKRISFSISIIPQQIFVACKIGNQMISVGDRRKEGKATGAESLGIFTMNNFKTMIDRQKLNNIII